MRAGGWRAMQAQAGVVQQPRAAQWDAAQAAAAPVPPARAVAPPNAQALSVGWKLVAAPQRMLAQQWTLAMWAAVLALGFAIAVPWRAAALHADLYGYRFPLPPPPQGPPRPLRVWRGHTPAAPAHARSRTRGRRVCLQRERLRATVLCVALTCARLLAAPCHAADRCRAQRAN